MQVKKKPRASFVAVFPVSTYKAYIVEQNNDTQCEILRQKFNKFIIYLIT